MCGQTDDGGHPRLRSRAPVVAAQARHALVKADFTVQAVDQPTSDPAEQGVVVKQKPVGGRTAAVGSQIVIYVGRLPAPTA